MLAWGIAPGIRLLIHQALKARLNAARVHTSEYNTCRINEAPRDRNEITAEVNRAFSAGVFLVT